MYLLAACKLCCTLLYFATVAFGNTANFTSEVLTVCEGKTADNMTVIAEEYAETSLQCGSACAMDKSCNSAVFIQNERLCKLLDYGYRYLGEKCGCLDDDVRSDFIFKVYPCYFQQPHDNGECQCENGYSGRLCENPPRDCRSSNTAGKQRIYIYPDICHNTDIYCSANGLRVIRSGDIGWYALRNSTWNTYKNFNKNNEGLDLMYRVTNTIYKYNLKIMVRDLDDNWYRSMYYNFRLGDEGSNYTVYFSHFAPVTGEPDQVLFNGTQFRTFDHNANDCVARYESAFWFDDNCTYPSLFQNIASIKGVMKDIQKLRVILQ